MADGETLDAPARPNGTDSRYGAVSCCTRSPSANAPLSNLDESGTRSSVLTARSRGIRAPAISPCCERVIASLFSGASADFLGSNCQRASWSIWLAVKPSLTTQPPPCSFQLAQRSLIAPRSCSRSLMTDPKVDPWPSGSVSSAVCTGTFSAAEMTYSRSASTGPSNFWMYSSGTPVMDATSCADIPERMCAWISRGASLRPAPGSGTLWRSFDWSTSSMGMRYRVPSSDVTRSAPFSTPMTLRSCMLIASQAVMIRV